MDDSSADEEVEEDADEDDELEVGPDVAVGTKFTVLPLFWLLSLFVSLVELVTPEEVVKVFCKSLDVSFEKFLFNSFLLLLFVVVSFVSSFVVVAVVVDGFCWFESARNFVLDDIDIDDVEVIEEADEDEDSIWSVLWLLHVVFWFVSSSSFLS